LKLIKNQDKKFLLKDIRSKIESNELKSGEKLLSTKELAGKYGIAIQTAQRLLKELVDEGFLIRKKGIGTFIKEKKNITPGRTVGLVMPCRGDIWAEFAASIVSGLQKHNINTIFVDTDFGARDPAYMRSHPAVKQLISTGPSAIIVYDTELGNALASDNPDIKIICISGESSVPMTKMDVVCPDLFHAGYMATSHLIKSGRKHITFYKTKPLKEAVTSQKKELYMLCEGYKKALAEAGLPEDIFVDSSEGRDDMKMFCDRLASRQKMDAIFVNFDFKATQFVQKAAEMGVNVPGALAVVSAYNTPWAQAYQLTSIDYHYELIAQKCVDIILGYADAQKDYKQVIKFLPELVIRKSCGSPASNQV